MLMTWKRRELKIDLVDEGICNLCGRWQLIAQTLNMQFCEECCEAIVMEIRKGFTKQYDECPFGWLFGVSFSEFDDCETCWLRIRCRRS